MKKIFISPLIRNNKYLETEFSYGDNWNNFFTKNVALFTFFSRDNKIINNFINNCDGVIIQGTGDIGLVKKNKINLLRDSFEKKIIKKAIKKKIPLLCVCRGFQLINNFFKGKLVKSRNFNHVKTNHLVTLKSNKFFKKKKIYTNSYHNYKIIKLAKKLSPIGRAEDNSIEIAISKNKKILCFMFHPERNSFSQKDIKKTLDIFFK